LYSRRCRNKYGRACACSCARLKKVISRVGLWPQGWHETGQKRHVLWFALRKSLRFCGKLSQSWFHIMWKGLPRTDNFEILIMTCAWFVERRMDLRYEGFTSLQWLHSDSRLIFDHGPICCNSAIHSFQQSTPSYRRLSSQIKREQERDHDDYSTHGDSEKSVFSFHWS
jgi:hypothetical protein